MELPVRHVHVCVFMLYAAGADWVARVAAAAGRRRDATFNATRNAQQRIIPKTIAETASTARLLRVASSFQCEYSRIIHIYLYI